MLINFEFTPLGEIIPWGKPGNHSLHWFGLTDGRYWIDAGEDTLFEYSERVRRPGLDRYCDYQVARLLEDITEMLPTILDPIPEDLVKYITGESGRAWMETQDSWCDRNLTADAGDEAWDVLGRANLLLCNRFLDSGYLTPSASILMWSDDADVHIEWENGDKLIDGELAWSAVRGGLPSAARDIRGGSTRIPCQTFRADDFTDRASRCGNASPGYPYRFARLNSRERATSRCGRSSSRETGASMLGRSQIGHFGDFRRYTAGQYIAESNCLLTTRSSRSRPVDRYDPQES